MPMCIVGAFVLMLVFTGLTILRVMKPSNPNSDILLEVMAKEEQHHDCHTDRHTCGRMLPTP